MTSQHCSCERAIGSLRHKRLEAFQTDGNTGCPTPTAKIGVQNLPHRARDAGSAASSHAAD